MTAGIVLGYAAIVVGGLESWAFRSLNARVSGF
jgi:hypothetical protein